MKGRKKGKRGKEGIEGIEEGGKEFMSIYFCVLCNCYC